MDNQTLVPLNTYDGLRMTAQEEVHSAIERAGDPGLIRIFDTWLSIEILCLIAPYGGVTPDGELELAKSARKLTQLLEARGIEISAERNCGEESRD